MTEPTDTAKEVADLQAVLDPRNGRTADGCIIVHEKVLQRSLDAITALQERIEALQAEIECHERNDCANFDLLAEADERIEALEKALEKAGQWVAVSERLPDPGTVALVSVRGRTLRAMWIPKHYATEDSFGEFLGDSDWSDDGNESYWPEGWYEWNQYEDTHWQTEHAPSHWMPLPLPPAPQEAP